jgi:hypothetical protein
MLCAIYGAVRSMNGRLEGRLRQFDSGPANGRNRRSVCIWNGSSLPHSCLWQTTSHQRVEVAASVRTYWPATSLVERRRIIMMAAASNSISIQRQSAAVATRKIP